MQIICLETLEKNKEDSITVNIDQRSLTSKGVIVDWDDSIIDLWEAIDDYRSILKVERMYKKNFHKATKKFTEEETDNIV